MQYMENVYVEYYNIYQLLTLFSGYTANLYSNIWPDERFLDYSSS